MRKLQSKYSHHISSKFDQKTNIFFEIRDLQRLDLDEADRWARLGRKSIDGRCLTKNDTEKMFVTFRPGISHKFRHLLCRHFC